MKISITSIQLKSPFHFFRLSLFALNIMRQLKTSNYKGYKKQGIWTKHYTMTLWENEADMKAFYTSGAHLEAMKNGASIAMEIRVLTIDGSEFPSWKEAKRMLLEKGRAIKY